MTKRTWVYSFGDTHCGLQYGLVMPETVYHDEGPEGELIEKKPTFTETQKLLLKIYDESRDGLKRLSRDDDVVVIHGGDLCHGLIHPEQLQTTRLSDQVIAGIDVLSSMLNIKNVRSMYLALGTDAHNGGEGSFELLAARALRDAYPDKTIKASSQWLLNVNGVRLDVAHHGPSGGIRYWTSGNALQWYIKSLVISDVMELGNEPVDAVLRYHFHTYTPVSHTYAYCKSWRDTLGFIHPPMCGMNYYGIKATKSRPVTHIGALILCIEDGRIVRVVDDFVHVLDRRTEEIVI
jgi:hypothetical protein